MKGELAEGVIPGLLQELYVGRLSGTLEFARESERQSVRVRAGHIVNAQSSVAEDRLGEMLVRRGLLSQADLERATAVVVKEKKRLGRVLIELGIIDQSGLEDALGLHVHEMLSRLFTWAEGTYAFREETEEPEGELTLKLSTAELILEAVEAIQDPDVVRYLLGDLDRVLALSNDPLLRFQKVTLSPTQGFIQSRIDGTTSARELMQMIPQPEEVVQKSLLGLLSTGIVEFDTVRRPKPAAAPRPSAAPPPAPPAPPPAASPPPAHTAAPPPVAVAPAAPAPAVAAPAPPAGGETDARRREILEAWEGLKTRNHFEVLGIPRASNELQVKEAYFSLARRFHPDVHHGASLGDLRDKLEQIFIRVGEAYEVLRDPKRRSEYEERLGRFQPRPPRTEAPAAATITAPEPEVPAPPVDPEEEARLVLEAIRRAERLYERGSASKDEREANRDFWDAIQLLEPAVEKATGKVKQRGRVALARCYFKNPRWGKQAEETLLAVAREEPKNVSANLLLAALYRDRGLRTRALAKYRLVLELSPENEEAAAYLAEHAPAPPPEEAEGGGLLKKLFRKG